MNHRLADLLVELANHPHTEKLTEALLLQLALTYTSLQVEAHKLADISHQIADLADERGAPQSIIAMLRHAARQLLAAIERGDVTLAHEERVANAQDICLMWVNAHPTE